jgi:hypothetical protein
LVSLQCDHAPCVSATGFSRSFGFQIAEMRKIAFQLFNGPDRALIGRSRLYRDIANRDFTISDVEVLCLLGFAITDFSMACFLSGLFPMALIFATRPSRWTVLIQPRDFATCDAPNICQCETPNVDMLMVPSMSATCPGNMDG